MKPPIKKCAVYTRKSSEEGLEQDFNSLDAQRESCLAYIASQKSENWIPLEQHYSDGGFSGGNMERPGLKKLLEDIKAGIVNIVVVYKIDRLTRSLMDFAKLVEIFDQHQVTFVSVTQSFNTTTSMGRLTLNVLLSFAQFEREVTGERIRDKIAASKKKGMWMGGTWPFGYDVVEKQLKINEEEARSVNYIYEKYLELNSVTNLTRIIKGKGIVSRIRTSKRGNEKGGIPFSRGNVYKILKSPIYIGCVVHKGTVYPGQHEPIVSKELWDKVQEKLTSQAATVRGLKNSRDINLLKGIMFDKKGVLYTPAFTKKGGRQYRYYITQDIMQGRATSKTPIDRLSAYETEKKVEDGIHRHLNNAKLAGEWFGLNLESDQHHLKSIKEKAVTLSTMEIIHDVVKRIEVDREGMNIKIDICRLSEKLGLELNFEGPIMKQIEIPYLNWRNNAEVVMLEPENKSSKDPLDLPPSELKNLVRGIIWRDEHFNGLTLRQIAARENFSEGYVGRCIFRGLEFNQNIG